MTPTELQIRTLIIPVDPTEPASVTWVGDAQGSLACAIGAELLACISGPGWHCYLEEDAHLRHRLNPRANRLMVALGWQHGSWVHGACMFLNHGGPGLESDVTDYVVALARRTGCDVVEGGSPQSGRDRG